MYQQIWQENVTTGHVNIQASCTGLPPVKHKARDLLAVFKSGIFLGLSEAAAFSAGCD